MRCVSPGARASLPLLSEMRSRQSFFLFSLLFFLLFSVFCFSVLSVNSNIMAAVWGNNIVRFTYTGAEGEHIPAEATHITVAEDSTFVRAEAFKNHRNIIELICHEGVVKIELSAFLYCPNLRRVIMPGVKVLEENAFSWCEALEDVECGKLEVIRYGAFSECFSLMIINLPSVRIVEENAFGNCNDLAEVHFGSKLGGIEQRAFGECISLERITIPLKDGLFTGDGAFIACENLEEVDLVEGAVLQETVDSFESEEWRNDMNGVIDSINQILPAAPAGQYNYRVSAEDDPGQKARAIRMWIRSVLDKIHHYKAEHQRVLDVAATRLQLALPQDIVMNSVLSFLQTLPSYSFEEVYVVEGEDDSVEGGDDSVAGEDSVEEEDHGDEEGDRVESESNCCCCCIQ